MEEQSWHSVCGFASMSESLAIHALPLRADGESAVAVVCRTSSRGNNERGYENLGKKNEKGILD